MHARWPIFLGCLIAGRAFGADGAASEEPVKPAATCGEVDTSALQSEQIHLLIKRVEHLKPGERMERSPEPSAAATRARLVCDKACTAGDLGACLKMGDLHVYGVGGPKDEKRAASLFTAGCDKDHAPSCMRLAVAYAFGQGVPEDHDRKLELFQKACNLGEKDACGLVRAVEKSAAKEESRQRALARMSPAERDGVTCTEPGPWTARRQAICERACKGRQPKACRALSAVYEGGHGVAPDPAKSIAYARKACKLGDQLGCTAADVLEENRRNGGPGVGILGALRAPPPRATPAAGTGAPSKPDKP